jgi:hypothetical protein
MSEESKHVVCSYCGEGIPHDRLADEERAGLLESDDADERIGICSECERSLAEHDQDMEMERQSSESSARSLTIQVWVALWAIVALLGLFLIRMICNW